MRRRSRLASRCRRHVARYSALKLSVQRMTASDRLSVSINSTNSTPLRRLRLGWDAIIDEAQRVGNQTFTQAIAKLLDQPRLGRCGLARQDPASASRQAPIGHGLVQPFRRKIAAQCDGSTGQARRHAMQRVAGRCSVTLFWCPRISTRTAALLSGCRTGPSCLPPDPPRSRVSAYRCPTHRRTSAPIVRGS